MSAYQYDGCGHEQRENRSMEQWPFAHIWSRKGIQIKQQFFLLSARFGGNSEGVPWPQPLLLLRRPKSNPRGRAHIHFREHSHEKLRAWKGDGNKLQLLLYLIKFLTFREWYIFFDFENSGNFVLYRLPISNMWNRFREQSHSTPVGRKLWWRRVRDYSRIF